MLDKIVKKLFNKEIVIYNKHRQTLPIVTNLKNKEDFIFINIKYIWRIFPLPGRYKLKFKVVYYLLNIINPKYILDINWINKWQSLYKVWTKKHPESKFIVVQHGSYVGGIVTDKAHRYSKCDIFLTWGDYFTDVFRDYNSNKKTKILSFGNPVYNTLSRSRFDYNTTSTGKILVIPSVISKERKVHFDSLIYKLNSIGFTVYFKGHKQQEKKGATLNYLENGYIKKINDEISQILKKNDFDFVISDHSTALLDAIYFKNRVLYFSPNGNLNAFENNNYSNFLKNIFNFYTTFKTSQDLNSFVSIPSQELLFSNMIFEGNNLLKNL